MKILSIDVGSVNMGVCIVDSESEKILHWDVLNIKEKTDQDTCNSLFRQLDSIYLINEIFLVLIEKQPFKNPKMRVIEGFIISYFVLRNCDFLLERKIQTYSPKYKLSCFSGPVPDFKVKSKYSVRKKTAIFRAKEFLETTNQDEICTDFFNKTNKKDDASDALCMALAYIRLVLNKKD